MSKTVLIPWAQTEWSQDRRLAARTPLPLDETGRREAEAWGTQLAGERLKFIFASAEVTSQETAAAVADATGARIKTVDGLEEVSCGLWEGLTEDTIRQRFPKVYKRWREDPSAVTPPDGESLADADERLRAALTRIRSRGNGHPCAIVVGPTACALLRTRLEGAALSAIRNWTADAPVMYSPAAFQDEDLVLKGAGADDRK